MQSVSSLAWTRADMHQSTMVAYIRHLIFDLKSKLLFYFDLFSFQNHFWFHFDFNIQFHSNLFSFQNHFHHGIFPPNTIFLICFIYFSILKPFSLWHIFAKCKFILKRNAFNFILISPRGIYPPFSVYSIVAWHISANGEPPWVSRLRHACDRVVYL